MEAVTSFVRNLICFFCFFQVFLHLVPKEQYRKYLKLFGNLILVFLLLRPAASLLGMQEEMEHILRQEVLKGEYSGLEMHMEDVAELQAEVVSRAFQEELKRQIRTIPEGYGLSILKMELEFADDVTPEKLTMKLLNDGKGDSAERIEKIKEEIQAIYGISREQMTIYVQG